MRKTVITAAILAVTGCTNIQPYAGLSVHSESFDAPEVALSTGLGFIGAEYTREGWGDSLVFCEHISGLSTTEAGAGLNHCGFKFRK
tara:strand:- start:172 stop:432 length:261 start_codon:yes stop_codon:yes gene_type:complete